MAFSYQWQRCVPGQYPAIVLGDGAAHHWRLAETDFDVGDAIGTFNGGTSASGASRGQPGAPVAPGNAATWLDGANGYVELWQNPGFDANDFTVEAWFKTTDVGQIWSSGWGGATSYVNVETYTDGNVTFHVSSNGAGFGLPGVVGATYSTDGAWHHVVATREGTTFRLYLDGTLRGERGAPIGDVDEAGTTSRMANSSAGASNLLAGTLDEVALYRRALTLEQVELHDLGVTCADIPGAVAQNYTATTNDIGARLRVRSSAINSLGASTAYSAPSNPTGDGIPANFDLPAVYGVAKVGETLNATVGGWTGPVSAYSYQWQRCDYAGLCGDISAAVAETYQVADADLYMSLRVRVTAHNAGSSSTSTSSGTTTVFGEYTYAQARARGYPVLPTPLETGLPACTVDAAPEGFATSQAAQAAVDAAPDNPICTLDPAQFVLILGAPAGHPPSQAGGRHWVGARTQGRFEGGRMTVEVGDPDVRHDRGGAADEQVNTFVSASRQPGEAPWVQTGWIESSTTRNDIRQVYSEVVSWNRTYSQTYRSDFELKTGRFYVFRVRDCRGLPDCQRACQGKNVCAEFFWEKSGSWIYLGGSEQFNCTASDGTPQCIIDTFLEINSRLGRHPQMNSPEQGQGVTFRNTRLRRQPNDWPEWTAGVDPSTGQHVIASDDAPNAYAMCWEAFYSSFRADLNLTC
jgi:hypothetical protein